MVIRDLLQERDWMILIDLKESYLSVPMAQEDSSGSCGRQTVSLLQLKRDTHVTQDSSKSRVREICELAITL